jgi:hypothetical protein
LSEFSFAEKKDQGSSGAGSHELESVDLQILAIRKF